MGVFQNNLMGAAAAAASAGGADIYDYQIANSVRMNGSDQYFNRTAGSTATNNDKKAISLWYKRAGSIGNTGATYLMSCAQDDLNALYVNDGSLADNFGYSTENGGANAQGKFLQRDFSAWYHLVFLYNSTESTGADRVKVYINGVHYTTGDTTIWTLYNNGYPGSGVHIGFGKGSNDNNIGRYQYNGSGYFNGYIADFIMIDGGTVPSISAFGEFHNGVWRPVDPSGLTFGENGCWLKFESSSDLGNDSSGNNNDWTANNFAPHDQMLDTPTFDSDSNGGNFCTANSVYRGESTTDAQYGVLSEGNLTHQYSGSADGAIPCTHKVPASGKWYWEYRIDGGGGTSNYSPAMGIMDPNEFTFTSATIGQDGLISYDQAQNRVEKNDSVVGTYSGSRGSDGDVMGIAVDMDNGAFYVSKEGTFQTIDGGSTGDPTSGASRTGAGATWTPASEYTSGMVPMSQPTGGSAPIITMNFGQNGTFNGNETAGGNSDASGYGNFFSAVPSGYKAVCSGNLSAAEEVDPAETDDDYPQELFFMSQYSGNGSGRTITTENQPDLMFIRHYSTGQNWYTLDSTRVITDNKYILLNTTALEATLPQANITSVGATSVGISSGTWLNSTGSDYQIWMWRANGGTTSTNTQGDIDSTVQVDPSGCFSIVKYTGGLSSSGVETVGHGLSKAPSLFITKSLEKVGNWWVLSDGQTSWNYGMNLQSNGASTDKSGNGSMSAPTSTVFSTNYTDGLNENGNDFIAYCFANCEGYIKSGSYIANGDADGTFVYTGFKPAMIIVKGVVSGSGWVLEDNKLSPFNPSAGVLEPNQSDALYTTANPNADLLSNGFKVRTTNAVMGSTSYDPYIYLAFAHNPFQYATAR